MIVLRTVQLLSLCSLLLIPAHTARADEIDPLLRERIIALLDVNGARQLSEQIGQGVIAQIVAVTKQTNPDFPASAAQIIEEVTAAHLSEGLRELYAQLVPLYAEHFSASEIESMLEFYASPAGIKSVAVMPTIAKESMQLGLDWASSQMPTVQSRIRAELEAAGHLE